MALPTYQYKIIVVGEAAVGKTSLAVRFTHNFFRQDYIPTSGMNFFVKNIQRENDIIQLQIWDTGGQERFRHVRPQYYKNAHGALLVYDITNFESFEKLISWLAELDRFCGNIPIVLVGNKKDLEEKREVPTATAEDFAKVYKTYFVEASAKTGENVTYAFTLLLNDIMGI
ncbi:MAG: GTP-binding protein [Candidatus Odinarchaeota archaeon]|nr:GTP-binding protein [Candidatus Odinarchaeota archaeon]